MEYGSLIVERTDAVATIRLNRPEKHNALNTQLCHELIDALDKLEEFPRDYMGIEAGRLAADARRAREELLALGPERFEEWDMGGIPRMGLTEST